MDDNYESLPLTGKISITACLGERTVRPACRCCGGSVGVRRAWRKYDKFHPDYRAYNWRDYNIASRGHKPRHKDHRR